MLSWFHALMPKEHRFIDLFADHASTVVKGAAALRALLDGGPSTSENYRLVMDRENDADKITREILISVRRSFITPFDRGAIRELITSMDNSIDQMQKTAKSIEQFEFTRFTPQMREMGDTIVKCATLVQEGIPLLRSMNTEAARISSITEQISALEGRADEMHDIGLHDLYKRAAANGSDALGFFVGNEVYDHLEKVVDRFDDVANVMHGIVIEHV